MMLPLSLNLSKDAEGIVVSLLQHTEHKSLGIKDPTLYSLCDREVLQRQSHCYPTTVVKHFITKGWVDPNEVFLNASANGCTEMIKFLYSLSIVDHCALRKHAVTLASASGYTETVVYLCSLPGVDSRTYNELAVQAASMHGRTETLAYLCSLPCAMGVDPRTYNELAMQLASRGGRTEAVRFLCSLPCVDPSVNDNRAFRFARLHGHTETVEFLSTLSGVTQTV